MTCPKCEGRNPKCSRCDGSGEVCGRCGLAADTGDSLCDDCLYRDQTAERSAAQDLADGGTAP